MAHSRWAAAGLHLHFSVLRYFYALLAFCGQRGACGVELDCGGSLIREGVLSVLLGVLGVLGIERIWAYLLGVEGVLDIIR